MNTKDNWIKAWKWLDDFLSIGWGKKDNNWFDSDRLDGEAGEGRTVTELKELFQSKLSQVEKDAKSESYTNGYREGFDAGVEKTNKRCIERAKRSLETYVWDSNIGDGLAKDGGHDYLIEVMENRKLLTKKVLSDLLEDKNNGK